MEIPETEHYQGTLLAIEEINAAAGVLGKPIQPVCYDPESDLAKYRQLADRLLVEDEVSVIFGCCTSSSRKAVLSSIERRNALLWYPTLYEGFEYSPNVIYTGPTPSQNALPLARFLQRNYGDRIYLIGSDYIYPRESNRVMRDVMERLGGELLDEVYVPMDASSAELRRHAEVACKARPDAIFSTLVGVAGTRFIEHCIDLGLDGRRTPIASHNMSEGDFLVIGRGERSAGHITSAPYFSSVQCAASHRFVEAYRQCYGARAPVSQYAEAAYNSVHLFARALTHAGVLDTQRLVAAAHHVELDAPQGSITLDEDNNHAWLWPRIGIWNGRDAFDIAWEAGDRVNADPFMVFYGGPEEMLDSALVAVTEN
jgi:branched-chain amino acid transport system substrate-binding protein